MLLVFWHSLAMVDVKASCNTGNSTWAIVKPDILPPFRRQRLLSSGHERKKCKFHHNSNEGTKHITKNIHFMISSYWWFLFIQHIINCKWSHNARLIRCLQCLEVPGTKLLLFVFFGLQPHLVMWKVITFLPQPLFHPTSRHQFPEAGDVPHFHAVIGTP